MSHKKFKVTVSVVCFILICVVVFVLNTDHKQVDATQELDLEIFANNKLDDLQQTGHWSHTNSDGCGFQCRTMDYRDKYTWIGENLYKGSCDIDNAYKLWEESPDHKAILDEVADTEYLEVREVEEDYCYIILVKARYKSL